MPHGPSRSTMTSGSPTCKISGFCSRNTDGTDEVKNNHQKRFCGRTRNVESLHQQRRPHIQDVLVWYPPRVST